MLTKLAKMLVLVAAVMVVAGCEDDHKSVQRSEQHHESQPQMVSPGQEVVE